MVTIDVTLGLISAILSFIFFLFCRYLVDPLTYFRLFPNEQDNQTISLPKIQTWLTYVDEERWQRLNALISWFHALLAGGLVIYSFLAYPDLRHDFVAHVNFVTYVTCSASFGYFCYDLCDVISNRKGLDLVEILVHHIITIIYFGLNVFRIVNIGYQMFTLLAEVNSIFLHGRKIFHLFNIPRENFFVRLNMVINIITFFLCRLCMLFFVTVFFYYDRYRMEDYYCYFGIYILIPIMWIINPILFFRLLHTDFIKRYKNRKLMS